MGRDEIISLIRKTNPNKAHATSMWFQCRFIYCQPIYSNMRKLANVIPIFKKGDKQLIKN